MADNNRATSDDSLIKGKLATEAMPKVYVEPCETEFFYEKFKQSYPMFKNPRGLCLIVNIYQIDGMPPRRWSNRDTESLRQLFEQLLFTVKTYTDSTHDLRRDSFKKIVKDFSEMPEHEDAQSCVICLMSHGEEGYLTTKEGDKVLLDELFTLFNNINCPNLAGKPKLFFIQSCRDDPISGPAEDLGIRLSFNIPDSESNTTSDETDGGQHLADNNLKQQGQESSIAHSDPKLTDPKQIFYHIPTLCDVLVGFPTQKGFIAYRKPDVGSWYMNAIVQVFSKHACDTDICALMNMVNSLISNEVTNTGKKQMSEFTSKLTKPYFYFFPGLASETVEPKQKEKPKTNTGIFYQANKKQRLDILIDTNTNNLIENLLSKKSIANSNFLSKYGNVLVEDENDHSGDQTDSNRVIKKQTLTSEHLEFVANKARGFWKPIAREIKILDECEILEIQHSQKFISLQDKLRFVLKVWWDKQQGNNCDENSYSKRCGKLERLLQILSACRLNKVKQELIMQMRA